jgi:hypothetical protein
MANAKGASLVAAVKWLRRERAAALRALPERLHHYLEKQIQLASWYPEEDLLEVIRAVARTLPAAAAADHYEQMGRFSAREQLSGVYRHLLEGGDQFSLPRRGLVLWQSQHDSGRLAMTMEGPGVARVEIVDFALPSRELCGVLRGYTAEMFAMADLEVLTVAESACRLDGADRCAWRIRWAPEPTGAAAPGH